MTGEQRYHGLDFLRGLMMLLGLVLHTAQYYMSFPVSPAKYKALEVNPLMDLLVISINGFRMPAFFALSGFFLALLLSRRGVQVTLKHRWDRIVKPFIVFLPITMIVMGFLDLVAANLMYGKAWGYNVEHLPFGYLQFFQTQHLWFMYYLLFYYLVAWAMLTYGQGALTAIKAKLLPLFQRLSHSVSGMFVIGAFVGLVGLGLDTGRVSGSVFFVPEWRTFLYFGAFFGLGALMFYVAGIGEWFAGNCWKFVLIASVAMYGGIALWAASGALPENWMPVQKLVLACLNGVAAWLYTAGFWGLALRYAATFRPLFRYVTDSAYWVYLVHLPILTALSLFVHFWAVSALVKFVLVLLIGTILCWVSYALLVRKTGVGMFLNGRVFDNRLPQRQ